MDLDCSVLHELQKADELTLAFNPHGLGGRLAPGDAASFQMASIARAVLAENVPDDVRNNFERARKLHIYGVLEYEFFTAASDYALLVPSRARSECGSSRTTAMASPCCAETPKTS